jgi:hypothetical protein
MISPADMLFLIPPWQHYAPPGWMNTGDRLMADVPAAFYPYYRLTQQALRQGEWPLWNPLEMAGMPLLANYQSAVFYPPRLVHAVFRLYPATTLYIILKLWLCGMTAYACARGIRLGVPAGRFLSVAWMLHSYNLIWCNWSMPDVSVWLPLLFLGVELALDGAYRKGFLTTALGGTLILLAGHPETAFAMSLGLGLYFLLRLIWERRWGRRLWAPLGVCAGAWAVALLACTAQILPFAEYLINSSTFFEREIYTKHLRMPPGSLVCFWVPRFFGTMKEGNYWGNTNSNLYGMIYPGIAVWFGVALLATRSLRPSANTAPSRYILLRLMGRAPRAVCLAVASCAVLVLTFEPAPLEMLYRLPVIKTMHQCYHVGFANFALPLLGAMGLDRWTAGPRKVRELARVLPLAAIAAAAVGLMYYLCVSLIRMMGQGPYLRGQILIAGLMGLLCLLTLAAYCFYPRPRIIVGLLTLFLAVDLIYANRGLNPTLAERCVLPDTALTRYLQSLEPPCRIGIAEGNIPSGLMAVYGIEDWLGYDGIYPLRITRFQSALGPGIWGGIEPVRATPYFLNDPRFTPAIPAAAMARLERVATLDGIEVYRNPRALPRAFLVGQVEAAPDAREMFNRMRAPDYDPLSAALVERTPTGRLPHAQSRDLGGARVVRRTFTHVTVDAEAREDCVLVLSDAYYPGWKATIDGQAAEIFPVYYAFRGLLLPAGRHTIEYAYAPWRFRLGLAISTVTLAASLILSARWLLRTRSMGAPA